MVEIERCTEKDAADLFGLFGEWDPDFSFDRKIFDESFSGIMNDSDCIILLAREGAGLVGYLQMNRTQELGFETFFEVAQLLVAENRRNGGFGRKLMEKAEEIALENGVGVIKLSSQVHRSCAHVFYEGLGYEFYKISKFYQKKISKV